MRRSYIRIGTKIDVQQGCLCTFEHNGLASLLCFIRQNRNICYIRQQLLAIFGVFCDYSIQIKCFAAVYSCNDLIFQHTGCPSLFGKDFRMYQVINPNAAAFVFIHISRTNAPLCRSDVGVATECFRQTVQGNVPRHYHMGSWVNFQVCGGNSTFFQGIQFTSEILWIQHNTGTDQAQGIRIQNTRRNQVQLIDLAVIHNRMPGIISAGCTYYNVCTGRHNIDNFPFPLVTPLGADNNICRHFSSSFQSCILYASPQGTCHTLIL